jgi:hypothetical protein
MASNASRASASQEIIAPPFPVLLARPAGTESARLPQEDDPDEFILTILFRVFGTEMDQQALKIKKVIYSSFIK